MAWVLLVNLSTFLTWVLLVNLTKNAQNFRRFAPNRAGVFIFIENLQNFGRGFLIEEGVFIFNTPVVSLEPTFRVDAVLDSLEVGRI